MQETNGALLKHGSWHAARRQPLTEAIDAGNRRWSDWVDLVRQIPPSERVVWSLRTATLMFKQASQPGENS